MRAARNGRVGLRRTTCGGVRRGRVVPSTGDYGGKAHPNRGLPASWGEGPFPTPGVFPRGDLSPSGVRRSRPGCTSRPQDSRRALRGGGTESGFENTRGIRRLVMRLDRQRLAPRAVRGGIRTTSCSNPSTGVLPTLRPRQRKSDGGVRILRSHFTGEGRARVG